MNKQQNHPIEAEPATFVDSLEQSNGFQWIMQNGLYVVYGAAALIAILALSNRLGLLHLTNAKEDYLQAEKYYQAIETDAKEGIKLSAANESFLKLDQEMKKHPELHEKYDGALAQMLIAQGNAKDAEKYASANLKRIEQQNMPFYSEFSKITLLIGKEEYSKALQESLKLKQQLEDKTNKLSSDEALIFAYNLLRIGMLQQNLSLLKEELATWQEWSRFSKGVDKEIASSMKALQDAEFKEGGLSLNDYISARERLLNN